MKRLLALFLSTMLIFSFAGCSKKEDKKKESSKTQYKAGTYTAKGDKWQYGQEEAVVEVKDGKITSITLRRLDNEGKEVDYEKWKGEKDESGKVYPNLKQYRIDMAKKMMETQSPDVDTISGATVSTKNWKVAVERALDQAKK